MKVNFRQPFKDLFGNPMLEDGKEMMINESLGFNLFYITDKIVPLNAKEKYIAYTLAVKLTNKEIDLEITPEEADVIDKVAARVYNAGAYGNIRSLLENKY